jgi:outer membrane protein assembly factor BamB
MIDRTCKTIVLTLGLALMMGGLAPASAVKLIRDARMTGGLIAQVGSGGLELRELGDRCHVRLLLPDAAAATQAQAAIDAAGLAGRYTVAEWSGGALPFADRALNALVLARPGLVSDGEARRVLTPRGLLITPAGVTTQPVPATIDDWTHYLYDASGNAVSKDKEVASPVSFRWGAAPRHLRSHNHGSSFTGLVTGGGRIFHFLDEGAFLFDQGGLTERWSLVARDAFNGALLWKLPLAGYGQPLFEDVSGQPVPDYIWRTPLSLNRRLVVHGDKLYAALNYREGPLSILDAATGKSLHAIDLGGIVDEIVAVGGTLICRVRSEIPMPDPKLKRDYRMRLQKELEAAGAEDPKAEANVVRPIEILLRQLPERIVAVDASAGRIVWRHDAPHVATQSLAMKDGRVVFHNCQALVCLDAATGQVRWTFDNPATERRKFGARNLLGNLLLTDDRVLWASSACGGGFCLSLADGQELWRNARMGTSGGFGFPTAFRMIHGLIHYDYGGAPIQLADGRTGSFPDVGGMLKRGHHIRCFPGKATERFLITPHRGAEFIDLVSGDHMVCDWLRGACSLGNMPANGLFYVSPDPCSCYAGARIYGFNALAPERNAKGEERSVKAEDRLFRGPAYEATALHPSNFTLHPSSNWPQYRHDARRTSRASSPLAAELKPAWNKAFSGELTPATIAGGLAFVARKDTYELLCLNLADGQPVWQRAFPAALDGPPTIVGDRVFLGCRDGSVCSLTAADGAVAWRFRAAPWEVLTLDDGKLAGLWPVSSSVLFHNGLIYVVAGRNSYLDGGIHVYALDPATGAVKHHRNLEGPRPDKEGLRTAVVTELDIKNAAPDKKKSLEQIMATQYATGYNLHGAEADLLVADEAGDLYLMQTKLTPALEPVRLERLAGMGITPMGGMHMVANTGFLDDTMFHRSFRWYDVSWPGYGTGSGWGARAGTMVAVGENQAYAAKHYEQGWYPTHTPGAGNRLVADGFQHQNTSGALADKEVLKKFNQYGNYAELVRTGATNWDTTVPIIVRTMLVAPDGNGGELVFSAGIVEGNTKAEWEKSLYYEGPGKLLVHRGADGRQLAAYDLPACPVYDGLSAADGKLLIPLMNGQIACFAAKDVEEQE